MKWLYACSVLVLAWFSLGLILPGSRIPQVLEVILAIPGLWAQGLWLHLGASLLRVLGALGLSLFVAIPLGILAGSSTWGDRLISPPAYLLHPVPKIAFLPITIMVLGLGELSKISLLVLILIIPLFISVRDAIKEIPRVLTQASAILGLSPWQRWQHVYVPAMIPRLLSALRIGIGVALSVLFIAENYATQWGIGSFIMNSWATLAYVPMFGGILSLSLVGSLILAVVDTLGKKLAPWAQDIARTKGFW